MLILPYRPDASWRHPPFGTIAMGLCNILVHLIRGRSDPEALKPYLLGFSHLDPLQWLTSAFLHADGLHLGGNMVFLYVFGAIVEDFLGLWFIPAYLALALGSGALEQVLGMLGHREGLALGASSAIYGVVAMAVLWAPRTRVTTLFWFILAKPFTADVRVFWLAGGFIALQIVSVFFQGGGLSSEFLHACGIVVGLGLGLLCLRRRWIDTDGDDLLAPERPRRVPGAATAPAALPVNLAADAQVARVTAAAAGGDVRVAVAAYDVLRREHPDRQPEAGVVERLVAMCEGTMDFHRAAAIGERTVKAGAASDCLRLQLARIHGQHLGDPEAGLAHLEAVRPEGLDPEAQAEYGRLRQRLVRKRETTRYHARSSSLPLLLAGILGLGSLAGAEPAKDPWATAPPAVAEPAPAPPRSTLPPVEPPKPATGRVRVKEHATIDVPQDLVYLAWPQVTGWIVTPPITDADETPDGLILATEQYDRLIEDRAQAASQAEWEERCQRFWSSGNPVEVYWEEGWIDPSAGLPAEDDLMDGFRLHAQIITRRQMAGPGVTLTIDGWGRPPAFDKPRGLLRWSIFSTCRLGKAPGMPGIMTEIHSGCLLGADGTVHLLCAAQPNERPAAELIDRLATRIAWERGRGFATRQPDGVGERTGGFRRLILPRLVFGGPENDPLVFRGRGLGFAWILILVPLAVAGWIAWKRIAAVARPTRSAAGPATATITRCPACGSQPQPGAARCLACGTSLLRR